KKTLTTVADSAAREGVGALIPFGGGRFDEEKSLINQSRQYFKNKTDKRLELFHEELLKDEGDKNVFDALVNKEFEIDDYYSILSKLVNDDEDKKTPIYSALFKAILKGMIPTQNKAHFIRAAKELTYSDIETMRILYIRSHFELKGEGNIANQVQQIISSRLPEIYVSVQNLTRLGFIETRTWAHTPNQLLFDFIQLLILTEMLTPISLGLETWRDIQVFVAAFVEDEEFVNKNRLPHYDDETIKHYKAVLNRIEHCLKELNVSYVIAHPDKFKTNQSEAKVIVLCLDRFENPMILYTAQDDIRNKELVKVILSSLSSGEPYDTIPSVESIATYNFTKESEDDLKQFCALIKSLSS